MYETPSPHERIANALEIIAQCMLKQTGEIKDDIMPVQLRASSGTCPECESINVAAHGNYPHNIYVCNDCSFAWVDEGKLK
jgi:transposase-like protein